MGLPGHDSFGVEDIARLWKTEVRNLLRYGCEDKLAISVPLFNIRVDSWVDQAGQRVPDGRRTARGLHRVSAADLWALQGRGSIVLRQFLTADGGVELLDDHPGIEVTVAYLLVATSEKERFEKAHDIKVETRPDETVGSPFWFTDDYSEIRIGGERFALSPLRARIIALLHDAWNAGTPWVPDERLFGQANSRSNRMVDVFRPVEAGAGYCVPTIGADGASTSPIVRIIASSSARSAVRTCASCNESKAPLSFVRTG